MRKNSNKLISYSLLFLTVFSIGFLIPEEPVYASGEFACADAVVLYYGGSYNHYRDSGSLSTDEVDFIDGYINTCLS